MLVLGIETSCDETSAAIVDEESVRSNIIATQQVHVRYGGVVPEFASRAHVRQLQHIVEMALKEADCALSNIDGIAVTHGPGLAGSLLVGLCFAKGLALSLNIPFVGVNHLEGHILSTAANEPEQGYPYISLVASGGHTLLVHVAEPLVYEVVGSTIDDAAGEAFDKVAKILGLGYPGGPAVEKAAKLGNELAIHFPRALLEPANLNFSFSGLKTSVLYFVQSLSEDELPGRVNDISASFQKAVSDVLVAKAMQAATKYDCKRLILAGGVARNNHLRKTFEKACKNQAIAFAVPSPELCTDNAGMIALAGLIRLARGERSDYSLDIFPNLALGQ
jgi:N6-L-threonylcarbamoyladenine synthase